MYLIRIALLLSLTLMSGLVMASSEEDEGSASATTTVSYLPMTPPFVVTVGEGKISYLKAEISLRVSDAALALVELHMPALRHELVMLMSSKSLDELDGAATRELIRQQALAACRSVLQEDGQSDGIKDLLFTNFIVQR